MLFAYDAVAFYMWRTHNAKKTIIKGDALGVGSRNKVCKHGRCNADATVC